MNWYNWYEVEAAKNDVRAVYEKLLMQSNGNIQSFIKENSKLRQEIKSLKQTIKKLTKEKEKYEKYEKRICRVNAA